MKYLLYALLLAFVIQSCKSKTSQSTIDTTGVVTSTDQSKALIEKFKPIIQGVWVKKDYIEKVRETKSPASAEDLANGITTMYINTNLIKADSLMVNVGAGNHEGSEMLLKFRMGKKQSTIIFGEDDLGYEINGRDTTLIVYHIEKGTITKYMKALSEQADDNLGQGMDYLINKGIIAGKYEWIDNVVSKDVIFTNDGKVSGLPGYKTYWIADDLGGEPMNNLDGIAFNIYTKMQKSFTFKIAKYTLKLYDTRVNADSTEEVVGDLKYLLVRKK